MNQVENDILFWLKKRCWMATLFRLCWFIFCIMIGRLLSWMFFSARGNIGCGIFSLLYFVWLFCFWRFSSHIFQNRFFYNRFFYNRFFYNRFFYNSFFYKGFFYSSFLYNSFLYNRFFDNSFFQVLVEVLLRCWKHQFDTV